MNYKQKIIYNSLSLSLSHEIKKVNKSEQKVNIKVNKKVNI